MEKSADAFRTISEVAEELALPQHVLRFWETRFPQVRPLKRAGGRRYYRPLDVVLLRQIRVLLYDEGYTIKGVQRLLKEKGTKALRAEPDVDLEFEGGSGSEGDAAANELDTALLDTAFDGSDAESFDPSTSPESMRRALGVLQLAAAHAKAAGTGFPALHDLLVEIEECQRILKAVRR